MAECMHDSSTATEYDEVNDDDFDLVVVNTATGALEERQERPSVAAVARTGSDDVTIIPDARETVELYAWNVIIGMVWLVQTICK